MKKTLTFKPTIFRDWSIAYCELAYTSATKEFKEQFGWSYSDLIFMWDGKKETLYRAEEEHIHGMFNFIKSRIEKEKDFIKNISQKLLKDIESHKRLLEKWLDLDLYKLDENKVLLIFQELKKEYIPLLPSFLIIMYFPQQIEQYYLDHEKMFKKDIQICLNTRSKVDKILAPITEKFLRRLGSYALNKSNLKKFKAYGRFLTIQEIETLLNKNYFKKYIDKLKKELQERKKYFLFAGGKIKNSSLKKYLKSNEWKLIEDKIGKNVNFIKGKSTYRIKCLIRGKVKIVENKEELFKIKKGDIVVAPMTTPEYAPIFKKVSAIITDEGGITCHASIISRELKIPCVTGTKIATKVLKDGDLVEVDAEKGIVRILKK